MTGTIMKGILASFAGMFVMACSGCGGGGSGPESPAPDVVAKTTCYITDPKSSYCVVDDAALKRSVVQYGDDSRIKAALSKARSGQPITIAAIGGSITQGAWSTTPENRYVSRVFGWWQATFPQSKMTLVNAGIGGTNSKYGNQRVQNDVLQYNPDFVIVEFANNDAPTPEFQASYRQLVQTIVDSPSHPAVLLMFTMDRNGANSEDNQIPVGRDMNLPMVGLREAIYPEEQAGKLNPADVTADEIHPNDLGHAIIAQLIAFRLQSALN